MILTSDSVKYDISKKEFFRTKSHRENSSDSDSMISLTEPEIKNNLSNDTPIIICLDKLRPSNNTPTDTKYVPATKSEMIWSSKRYSKCSTLVSLQISRSMLSFNNGKNHRAKQSSDKALGRLFHYLGFLLCGQNKF